jgi:hypothetical protein
MKKDTEESYKPSPYLERILKEAEEEYAAGRSYGPFSTVEELIEDVES